MKQVIYKINSDNYQDAYLTEDAYKALTLQMSSGDYGAHKATKVSKVPKGAKVLTLDDIDPEASFRAALESYVLG